MEDKEIARELDRVFIDFLSLFDDECQKILKEKAYLAGGCVYSLANDKPVNDYDIFLLDVNGVDKIAELPLWKYKTEYALSYGKYQIVTKYYGSPDDCVGQFDFKHNMFYYVPGSKKIKKACASFRYLRTNKLSFNEGRARDLEGVFLRVEKFRKRGFVVPDNLEETIGKKTTKRKINAYKKRRKYNPNNY